MRKVRFIALFSLLTTLLIIAAFPGTSMARVFRVFGPETFTRSAKGPATEVRQFLVQYPRVYDYTLHIFNQGITRDLAGKATSAVVTLNGEQVATPKDFIRNTGYIKKSITLKDLNTLSMELRGKPGSEMKVVITARNDEPLSFDFLNVIHPDGSGLFGPGFDYFWKVVKKPGGSNVTLFLAQDPSSPELVVDKPGEYALELVISGGFWKTDPIPVKLFAAEADPVYPDYIPVPVKTRIVTGDGSLYGNYYIQVGNTTYPAPAPTSCDSDINSGFQVLVLDRVTLAKKDHKSFNVPCGNTSMVNFLNTLDSTSLVIVSSLNWATAKDVCNNTSSCPLGEKLIEFGATDIFTANYSSTLNYTVYEGGAIPIQFSYSLIGVRGLGQDMGFELNDWDHKVYHFNNDGLKRLSSNIEGSFVKDANPGTSSNWTFVYPEFIEIDTNTGTTTAGNTIMVGSVPYQSTALPAGAMGAFQTVQLYGDTLSLPSYPSLKAETYFTNSGTGTGSVSESEQQRLLDDLSYIFYPGARYITLITTLGTPIGYKSTYFADLIKTIGNDLGGTIGILNDLGGATYSYSLFGMTNPTSDDNPVAYPLGSADTVDAMSPDPSQEHNLRVVMQKNKQGWFKPAIKYTQALADKTGSPDFSLVSVALQPSVPWPLPDPSLPTTDATYQEQLGAYQYISGHVDAGIGVTDIRSRYVGASDTDASLWWSACQNLSYTNISNPGFSQQVFTNMKIQLCGDSINNIQGEFDYVREVSSFKEDMDTALVNMQIGSNNNMDAVYQTVKDAVPVKETDKIAYDAVLVARGVLMVATAVVPIKPIKATMGALNAALMIATAISKNSGGADYTTIDTEYSSLQTQMNSVWGNCTTGTHKLVSMIKSDWGKLKYVGRKFMLPHDTLPADGGPGWQYDRTNDPDNWKKVVTNSLQAYYLQCLMPAVWHIDYMLDSTIVKNPKNFGYTQSTPYNITYHCTPYCMDISDNVNAYQVDAFSSGSSWYVLTSDGMYDDDYCTPCACVRYSDSATIRDILFGSGEWNAGEKMQLDKRGFYERWLPSSVYRLPVKVDLGTNYYYSTSSCYSWGP